MTEIEAPKKKRGPAPRDPVRGAVPGHLRTKFSRDKVQREARDFAIEWCFLFGSLAAAKKELAVKIIQEPSNVATLRRLLGKEFDARYLEALKQAGLPAENPSRDGKLGESV